MLLLVNNLNVVKADVKNEPLVFSGAILAILNILLEGWSGTYKKKIKNTIVFGIIAELIFVILALVQNYYGYTTLPDHFSGGGSGGGGGGGW